jgi:hypothetical protein
MDVGFTFGTCSGRHCSPPKDFLFGKKSNGAPRNLQ